LPAMWPGRPKVPSFSPVWRSMVERAIDELGANDVLVLAEWDRATRSMMDGITIMQRVHARGAAIKVLDKPHLDLTTKVGQGFLARRTFSNLSSPPLERRLGFQPSGKPE